MKHYLIQENTLLPPRKNYSGIHDPPPSRNKVSTRFYTFIERWHVVLHMCNWHNFIDSTMLFPIKETAYLINVAKIQGSVYLHAAENSYPHIAMKTMFWMSLIVNNKMSGNIDKYKWRGFRVFFLLRSSLANFS